MWRTPNPPWSLGVQTLSQEIRVVPLSSIPYFLQKQCLRNLLICSTIPAGNKSVLIKKVGRLVKTDLIKVSLSPYESIVEQPDNLLSILLMTGAKSSILGLTRVRGSPKYYVKGKAPMEHPREVAKISILTGEMLIGTIADFS